MPKVSVILPNYNHARFLPQRIESILNQTYSDFDLLILDDVSTDDSRTVIDRYKSDPRVTTSYNDVNSGSPYRQWRTGLARTRGEYVWIAESDDFSDLQFLGRLVDLLDRHPRVGIATSDSWEVDSGGNIIRRYSDAWRQSDIFADYDISLFDEELVMEGREYLRRYMDPWNTIPNASAALFRRAALEAIGGPVIEMKLCGDWLTYCKVLTQYDMGRVPEPLNYFRQHAVSVRTQVKTVDFLRESVAVHAYVAGALNLGVRHMNSRRVREFFSQALIAGERAGTRRKVPFRRIPAVLHEAAKFGTRLWLHTLRNLLKEQAGSAARKLHLR